MKKIISFILVAVMVVTSLAAFASCGKGNSAANGKSKVKVYEAYDLTAEKYAFAVAKENTALKTAANELLAELKENGELEAKDGNTEFSHIPSWFEWEREQVKRQIENGEYSFEDEVDVYSLPNTRKFIPLGKATLKHQPKSGFTIEGHYNGEDFKISRPVAGMYGVHIEFDYCYIRPEPCIQISISNDTFVCFPTKKNVVMKLLFATEELYKAEMAERIAKRAQRKAERESKKE